MIRNATLIYNPRSGRKHHLRERAVSLAAAALREAGVEVQIEATAAPAAAGDQARKVADRGGDAVIACGGDGTVLEVLQGLVGSNTALGVIPMGTKNALAYALGLPLKPQATARALLRCNPFRVAVGRVEFETARRGREARYFMSAAGVGADAEMMYGLAAGFDRALGMWAYYREGLRVFLKHDYPDFEVTITTADGELRRERVSDVLAVRVSRFGGLLDRLAPGAELANPTLRLVLFKTRRRWPYVAYLTAVLLRRERLPKDVELVDAVKLSCDPITGRKRIYVEADGELLGTLPVSLEIVPDGCLLLAPSACNVQSVTDARMSPPPAVPHPLR